MGAWRIVPVKRKGVSGSFLIVAKCIPKRPFWLLAGRFQSIFSRFGGRFGAFSHTAFPHSAPDDFSLSAE